MAERRRRPPCPRDGDIIDSMDPLDLVDDVCDRCRHTLNDDGACPSCGWVQLRDEGPHPP